jgi:hypothetical protein
MEEILNDKLQSFSKLLPEKAIFSALIVRVCILIFLAIVLCLIRG